MAHHTTPTTKTHQHLSGRSGDRRLFTSSDDNVLLKQVTGTHAPDGREIDVRPILHLIEEILRHGASSIQNVMNGNKEHTEMLEDKTSLAAFDGMLEAVAYMIQKISCEISCKCIGGGDAHASTMTIFNTLSNYSWESKVVLSLAAFAVLYGEFLLVAQLFATNSLAKSVALLKQLPDVLEHSNSLKPQFDALNKLIKAMMDVTVCIIKFTELPPQYITSDTPAMAMAMSLIPSAAYWTVRSVLACAARVTSLVGLSHEYITSTTETWELSSLAHKVTTIHEHLLNQINQCHLHIDEKKHLEAYHNLVRLFETLHLDNMKVMKALLYSKDDQPPLFDGTNRTRVHVEVLRRKHVLFLISDLDLTAEEIMILDQFYRESKARPDSHYEIVWLPIIDKSTQWHEGNQRRFEELQGLMPWFSVHSPLIVEPAVTRYIKEAWHFSKKEIIVSLDPQGRVASKNALHMLWIWGNIAFPFSDEREETLWKAEAWRIELLIDGIDPALLDWMNTEGRFVCLYGGEDINWIRKFTTSVKEVAKTADIQLEIVYVGKSKAKERVRKTTATIGEEQLSNYWPDITSVWFFWERLESMLYSKLQQGKTAENDHIMQEIMTILSFDGSDQGWAIFFKGSMEMARAKGDTALTTMEEFKSWESEASTQGFMPALNGHINGLQTTHHCNRLILPGISGGIPEKVVCAECGRAMEKYFMYRCCVD